MAGGAVFSKDEKSLFDWVRDFRMKKLQMKKKVRRGVAELRVCAILATALKSAEKELRRKQEERYNRWSEIHMKLIQNKINDSSSTPAIYSSSIEALKKQEENEKRRKDVAELWRNEIESLDEFMSNMSSKKCVAASS